MKTRVFLILLALWSVGCPTEEVCRFPEPNPDAPVRTLEASSPPTNISDPLSTGFEAWQDDDLVPIILGFQGGYMVTPVLRFPAEEDSEDTRCVSVVVRNFGEGLDGSGLNILETATRDGDYFYIDPLDNFLSRNPGVLHERRMRMQVTVRDEDFQSELEVTIEMVDPDRE